MIIDKIKIGDTSYDIGVAYSNVSDTPTNLSDFTNDEGFIDKNVSDLTNYTPSSETTSQLELVINSDDYKLKGILKDSEGNVIYTSNEIDLPLETMVVNATYDSETKEIVLTLQNGTTTRFSVADLVNGLVSETDLETALANYYTKNQVDGLLTNYIKEIKEKGTKDNPIIMSNYEIGNYILFQPETSDSVYFKPNSENDSVSVFEVMRGSTVGIQIKEKIPETTGENDIKHAIIVYNTTLGGKNSIYYDYRSATNSFYTTEATDVRWVTTGGSQFISGVKTFTNLPKSSFAPTTDYQFTNKKYVDDTVATKQNVLTAGDNINIETDEETGNTVISASGGSKTYYWAGTDTQEDLDMFTEWYQSYLENGYYDQIILKTSGQVYGISYFDYFNGNAIYFAGIKAPFGINNEPFLFASKVSLDISNNIVTSLSSKSLGNANQLLLPYIAGYSHYTTALTLANTYPYTPTSDYHPATKKYVDDSVVTYEAGDNITITDNEETGNKVISATGGGGDELDYPLYTLYLSQTPFDNTWGDYTQRTFYPDDITAINEYKTWASEQTTDYVYLRIVLGKTPFSSCNIQTLKITKSVPYSISLYDSAILFNIRASTSTNKTGQKALYFYLQNSTPAYSQGFTIILTPTNAETISGVKTFSTLPESSVTPTNDNQFTNKAYVDGLVGDINTVLATLTTVEEGE